MYPLQRLTGTQTDEEVNKHKAEEMWTGLLPSSRGTAEPGAGAGEGRLQYVSESNMNPLGSKVELSGV